MRERRAVMEGSGTERECGEAAGSVDWMALPPHPAPGEWGGEEGTCKGMARGWEVGDEKGGHVYYSAC